jgi:hypothetical protein
VTSFSEDGRVLNGYVTNPNPTPTLTPNRNPNSNPNQINEKIQKETTLEIDQITKCQFGRWKLVKTVPDCITPLHLFYMMYFSRFNLWSISCRLIDDIF